MPQRLRILALALLCALATSFSCSGTQHSWRTTTDAALSGAAHAVDAVDAIAADRYTAQASLPGADLAALDARFSRVRAARQRARARLMAAEAALTGGGCDALVAVRLAREGVSDIGEALALATDGEPAVPALVAAVRGLVDVIAAGPVCPATTGAL